MITEFRKRVEKLKAAQDRSQAEILENELSVYLDELNSTSPERDEADELLSDVMSIRSDLSRLPSSSEKSSGDRGVSTLPREESRPSIPQRTRETLDSETKKSMDEADDFFYGGNFKDARSSYEQVLEKYPDYPSAVERLKECLEIIQGKKPVPSAQLPKDAGHLFGQARSASRVGRYNDALVKMEEAMHLVRDAGIRNWEEGQSLYDEIVDIQNAERAYGEAIQMAGEGKWAEAWDKLHKLEQFGYPKYTEAFKFINEVQGVVNRLSLRGRAIDVANLVGNALDELDDIYIPGGWEKARDQARGKILGLFNNKKTLIRSEVDNALPRVSSRMVEDLEQSKKEADELISALNAWQKIEGADQDINRLLTDVKNAHDKINSALMAPAEFDEIKRSFNLNRIRTFVRELEELRKTFPKARELRATLAEARTISGTRTTQWAIIGILAIIILWISGRRFGPTIAAQLAPTSTPTPTATYTPTSTPTYTPIPTDTPAPTITPSPTFTLTPDHICLGQFTQENARFYESPGGTSRLVIVKTFIDVKVKQIFPGWYLIRYEDGGTVIEGWVNSPNFVTVGCP